MTRFLLVVLLGAVHAAAPTFHAPPSRTVDVADVLHGVEVADPYRWLEDVNAPEVQAWMKDQDAATRAYLAALPARGAVAERLKELFYLDVVYMPEKRGDRYFYQRRGATQEKAVYYWKDGARGKEHVLLDPHLLSPDGSTAVDDLVPSWDGKYAAYNQKENNADEAVLHIKEVETGKVLEEKIPGTRYAVAAWTPDSKGFYYNRLPPKGEVRDDVRPGEDRIYFHRLGDAWKDDRLVVDKTGDPTLFHGVELSRDGRFLFYEKMYGWTKNEVYYKDLEAGWKDFKEFFVPAKTVEAKASVFAWDGYIYIRTNDKASRWKLERTPAGAWDVETIVPEHKSAVLEGFQIAGGRLILTYLENAQSRVEVRELDGKTVRTLEYPDVGSSGGVSGEPGDDELFYGFSSFTRPSEIYRTSVRDGGRELYAKVEAPIDPSPYVVEQVWYPSKDGTKVSMFLVHRKDLKKDGKTPWLLYGYGGFNVKMRPSFRSSLYPWLEAGGGYAVANLRGGGEYGEAWHRAGMLENKQNVFDDFIAAGEWLVKNGYTKNDRLAIRGGSNGGLLVGAALVQRPDLFGAVVCQVPLLDMVRYHLHGSGRTWIAEYGSAEDAEQFKTLYAYSPYHHVKKGARYPATLIMTSDTDDRVDPLHARKMAARLQTEGRGGPVLLRIETQAGHGGGGLVKKWVDEGADLYAFLMTRFSMKPGKKRDK